MTHNAPIAASSLPAEERDLLLVDRPAPGVLTLTMNRPSSRNSLSRAMIGALHKAIDAASVDPRVSAVVIAANGPAFSSGHDLKELAGHRDDGDGGRAFYAETIRACSAMMQAIVASPKPVI